MNINLHNLGQIIDKLIERTNERAPPRLYLVDSLTRAIDDDPANCLPATIPTSAFQSPVLGWSLQQLREHYETQIPETGGIFSSFVFIVLDERTTQDETCRIVSIYPDPLDPTAATITARADFYVAVEVLIPVDVRSHILNEGQGDENKEDGGQGEVLYTKERMIAEMGPDFNMKDYAQPPPLVAAPPAGAAPLGPIPDGPSLVVELPPR
jgi:hypothetical protein